MEDPKCHEIDSVLKHTQAAFFKTVHCLILSIVVGFAFCEEHSSSQRD